MSQFQDPSRISFPSQHLPIGGLLNRPRAGTLQQLRVWDQTGVSAELEVTLPGDFKAATPVNLRGENAGQPVSIRDRKLAFHLHAYAPASYLLE